MALPERNQEAAIPNSSEKFGPISENQNPIMKAKEACLQEPARDEEQSPINAKESEVGLIAKTLNKICLNSQNSSDSTGHSKKI